MRIGTNRRLYTIFDCSSCFCVVNFITNIRYVLIHCSTRFNCAFISRNHSPFHMVSTKIFISSLFHILSPLTTTFLSRYCFISLAFVEFLQVFFSRFFYLTCLIFFFFNFSFVYTNYSVTFAYFLYNSNANHSNDPPVYLDCFRSHHFPFSSGNYPLDRISIHPSCAFTLHYYAFT